MRIPHFANWAPEVHTFCPLTSHSSPSRSARHCSPARSDPAPGSENSWHQTSCPLTIIGRNRAHCSSVPWSMIAGPAIITPMPLGGPTAPTDALAACTRLASCESSPRPNQRSGHVGNPQPLRARTCHQSPSDISGSQASWNQCSADRASGIGALIPCLLRRAASTVRDGSNDETIEHVMESVTCIDFTSMIPRRRGQRESPCPHHGGGHPSAGESPVLGGRSERCLIQRELAPQRRPPIAPDHGHRPSGIQPLGVDGRGCQVSADRRS